MGILCFAYGLIWVCLDPFGLLRVCLGLDLDLFAVVVFGLELDFDLDLFDSVRVWAPDHACCGKRAETQSDFFKSAGKNIWRTRMQACEVIQYVLKSFEIRWSDKILELITSIGD